MNVYVRLLDLSSMGLIAISCGMGVVSFALGSGYKGFYWWS